MLSKLNVTDICIVRIRIGFSYITGLHLLYLYWSRNCEKRKDVLPNTASSSTSLAADVEENIAAAVEHVDLDEEFVDGKYILVDCSLTLFVVKFMDFTKYYCLCLQRHRISKFQMVSRSSFTFTGGI
ncbi:uncharacterized protein LOC143895408 [Temnothorax americanus]|uniref:uncharacterized protein LOC143895408 n=1 Tax=Temnothorax americanus TaxID=1964332 RepID=UPI004068EE42